MIKTHAYILTLKPSGFFYVGSTSDIEKRKKYHTTNLKNGTHHNVNLQNRYNDDETISFYIIEMETREKAYEFEQRLLVIFRNNFLNAKLTNIGLTVFGGDNLTNHPNKENIVKKIVDSQKQIYSQLTVDERLERFSRAGEKNGMYGKKHTADTRLKISNLHMGHSYNKGCKLSPEHIEKIRVRGKLLIGEKNPFYGKHHSSETKKKLSETRKGGKCHTTKTISAGGIVFETMEAAARHYNISNGLVGYRCKSDKYIDWVYL